MGKVLKFLQQVSKDEKAANQKFLNIPILKRNSLMINELEWCTGNERQPKYENSEQWTKFRLI